MSHYFIKSVFSLDHIAKMPKNEMLDPLAVQVLVQEERRNVLQIKPKKNMHKFVKLKKPARGEWMSDQWSDLVSWI